MIREACGLSEPSSGLNRGGRHGTVAPLTRIFIDAQGDLVITDLWEPVQAILGIQTPTEESEA